MNDCILKLEKIKKSFGSTEVLREISLEIKRGEFVTLLGSSGCGKTTTLRIIAGLEIPDSGQVILEDKIVTKLEPNKRNLNTVFQNYALFPHMNVEDNVAYGLKIRKIKKSEIKKEVEKALDMVQLLGFEKRKPNELSGGQMQRVAIARGIINKPKVLLLDEPLGALDLKLRREMQLELKKLQKKLGITFIYITHDQEEALNMSDRIVVMRNGKFEQIGNPAEVYDRPKTSYVAEFVGAANIIKGTAEKENNKAYIKRKGGRAEIDINPEFIKPNEEITVAVRSENINLYDFSEKENYRKEKNNCGFEGMITEKTFAGGLLRISVKIDDGQEVISSRHGIDSGLKQGDKVYVCWEPKNSVVVDRTDKNE